jgi:hypothetical protein
MSGKPKPGRPTDAEQLRELLAEAHGVIKDLRAGIREARDEAKNAAANAATAANEELARFGRHLQKELNRHTADLQTDVDRAQRNVIDQLTLAELERVPGTQTLKFRFGGHQFDANIPLPDAPGIEQ